MPKATKRDTTPKQPTDAKAPRERIDSKKARTEADDLAANKGEGDSGQRPAVPEKCKGAVEKPPSGPGDSDARYAPHDQKAAGEPKAPPDAEGGQGSVGAPPLSHEVATPGLPAVDATANAEPGSTWPGPGWGTPKERREKRIEQERRENLFLPEREYFSFNEIATECAVKPGDAIPDETRRKAILSALAKEFHKGGFHNGDKSVVKHADFEQHYQDATISREELRSNERVLDGDLTDLYEGMSIPRSYAIRWFRSKQMPLPDWLSKSR